MVKFEGLSDYIIREIDREEWNTHWNLVHQSNLLQSWEYGDSKANAENWKPIRFLFESSEGRPIALAQVLTKTWGLLGGVARLNRGPLFLLDIDKNFTSHKALSFILQSLKFEARRRRWWILYFAPELPDQNAYFNRLRESGFVPRSDKSSWASARLDLSITEDAIMGNLNGKWRNLLRKAQKSNLIIERIEGGGYALDELLESYSIMQTKKNFSGLSNELIRQLSSNKGPKWLFSLYKANIVKGGSLCCTGMLVSVRSGDCATYLIGYTDDDGRKFNSNYILIWQALLDAKKQGCRWFDLGGINENTPKGIAHFKKGLNGQNYNLIGEFRLRQLM